MKSFSDRLVNVFAVLALTYSTACSTPRQYHGTDGSVAGVNGGVGGTTGSVDGGSDLNADTGPATGGSSAMGGHIGTGGNGNANTGGAHGAGGSNTSSGGMVAVGGTTGTGGMGAATGGSAAAAGGKGGGANVSSPGGLSGSAGIGGAPSSCTPACTAPVGGTATCVSGICRSDCTLTGTTICGDTCVDRTTDAKNCGSCGHDCLGGTCELGTCLPFQLANGQGHLTAIMLDASHVYWGGVGIVGQTDKSTVGAMKTIAMSSADSLGIGGGRIYWAYGPGAQPTYSSCALPNCAGGVMTSTSGASFYTTVIGDQTGQKIFWEASYPASTISWSVQSMDVATKMISTLLTDLPETSPLAIDDEFIYLTDGGTNLEKVPFAGGVPTMLAAKDPSVSVHLIAVCGPHLYWASYSPSNVYAVPLPNGLGAATGPMFAAGIPGQIIDGLACDNSGVYWSNQANGQATTIVMCPHDGCNGSPTVLALGQDRPSGIATDTKAIYWVTNAGGVFELAK